MVDIMKSILGIVVVELTSAEPEIALETFRKNGIELFRVQRPSELTIRFSVLRTDVRKLQELAIKRGYTLQIVNKTGLFWRIQAFCHRPLLLVAIMILITVSIILPGRVLFVSVEGNQNLPERMILEAAENCGICFGAKRAEVRSERIKNSLLSSLPQLQWAGVNTRGCVAVISVREKSNDITGAEVSGLCSIVASQDGIVTDCTVWKGDARCAPGQRVQTGQILISAFTDCGMTIQATSAEGEIYADTSHVIQMICLKNGEKKGNMISDGISVSFLLGKKRIFLWKGSRIDAPICDRMYEEFYLHLPGGFTLPMGICIERFSYFDAHPVQIPTSKAKIAMGNYAMDYLAQQMIAGKILEKKEEVSIVGDVYKFRGDYQCNEMIGRVLPEKIGAYYGKIG